VQTSMLALEGWLQRHRRLVLIVWALAFVVAAPLAAGQSEHLTSGGFAAPGSQSDRVEQSLHRFPGRGGPSLAAVLVPQSGARPADLAAAAAKVGAAVAHVDGVRVAGGGTGQAAGSVRTVVLPLAVEGGEERSIDIAKALREKLGIGMTSPGSAAGGRVDLHVAGQGGVWAAVQARTQADVETAEVRGFPVIAIVLLLAFGSLAAVVLPLGLGVASLVVSGALIFLLSLAVGMSVFVTSVSSMLGLGVAVDYSLFVLVRYREELDIGRSAADARAQALATSGLAVAFSGITVMASLAGLCLVDSTALRSIAAGAILVVAVSVLAASTLLPVLIAVLGERASEPGRLARMIRRRRPPVPAERRFWVRWSRTVMRRPGTWLLTAIGLLVIIAAPALSLNIENPGVGQLGRDDPLRAGLAAAVAAIGPGTVGPVQVLVAPRDGTAQTAQAAVGRLEQAARRDPAVRTVGRPLMSSDGHAALLTATLDADPSSERARDAVGRLRTELSVAGGDEVDVSVGGTTGVLIDFDHLVGGSMWKIAVFVLALSFVVLLVLLRSVLLAVKAVLMTMLSVLASYGVLVAVFQWGWLEVLGLHRAPYVDTITPPLVLVIAFGLSMDYEVFMLSRIRERYAETGDTRQAVAEGLASSGRTITSAALIMVAVFLAFVTAGLPSVQRLGVATAAAIALDATLVRLMLVPAAMVLLGRWNWWLPRPLERILPGGPAGIHAGPVTASLPLPAGDSSRRS
jgi:uncharacterized membrane protein YdfJ with MMPL/SSD domain